MKRALSLILLLAMLATMMVALPSAASAEPSRAGCTGPKSPDGKHAWIGRPRDAWCTYGGGIVYVCQYCNKEVFEESTPALGHNWGAWDQTSQPDCTHAGQKVRYCRRCQQQETQTVPAIGHKWDSGTVTKQPTCTQEGEKIVHCTNKFSTHNCTATQTVKIPKTDHKWGEWKQDEPGTCIERVLLVRKCSVCGTLDYKYGDYGDHDWGEWEVVKEPTATEPGEERRVCKNTPNHVETREIPATGGSETSEAKLTVTLVSKNDVSYTPQTEFEENELVWVTGVVTNTGNVDIELYDYDMAISTGYKENRTTSETESSGYILKPGQSYEGISTWFIADANHSFTATDVIPGTETETLYGKVTYTATVPGYKPGTKEVLCTGTGSATIGILKGTAPDDGPHPALHLEITWDENAGEGKRYEGAEIPLYYKVTNTGDCTVYTTGYSPTLIKDIVYPNGEAYVPELGKTTAAVQPGESWTYTSTRAVKSSEVEDGYVLLDDYDYANYLDSDGKPKGVDSDIASVNILLTYPENSGKIEVQKVDADTGDALEGALLQVLDDGGEVVDQWTSSAENSYTVQGLLSGKQYTLREARTPEGYDTAADIQFVLNEDGKITTTGTVSAGGVLVVEDKKLDDGPHPSLLMEATWAPDAGEGKRVEGARVQVQFKMTNTGDCPIYKPAVGYDDSVCSDLVYPRGLTYVEAFDETKVVILNNPMYVINPGEFWTYTYDYIVKSAEVENGFLNRKPNDFAAYLNPNGRGFDHFWVYSNRVPINIPLTYPDGVTPEEDKPAIKLTVTQNEPEKEAYADTDDNITANKLTNNVTVTNTGNVPLRFNLYVYIGPSDYQIATGFQTMILNPGESWNIPDFWYYINCDYGYLPPDSADYAGIFAIRFKVFGYAVDDTERTTPICESNPVTFKHNIAKPGPTPWPIPEESQLEVEIGTDSVFEAHFEEWYYGAASSDPAGYQLGEAWSSDIRVANTGPVDVDAYTLHQDVTADISFDTEDRTYGTIAAGDTNDEPAEAWGLITEGDVDRGYIEVTAYAKWTDPDSGKERTAVSNVWHQPVISKTGLVLTKKAADPPNGEYYKPGEKVNWTLDVTNNSKEPIKNVTVTDNGMVIATFAEIAAGETKNCAVPPTIVTDYDAQVTGYVMNTAKATGTDLKDATHTWYSNPAKAVCKDPDTPPVLGAKPGLAAVKTDNGPANMAYYQQDEEITFNVTVTNTGDCELNNLEFYDSLAGFAPVDTLASLPVAASHTFIYKYTVKEGDMNYPTLTNTATIKYTFLGNPGTPVTCKDTVKIGENDTITETGDPPFDPGLLKGDGDSCSLTLETLGANDARYTLHACGAHDSAATEAETARLAGDWKKAAEIWQAEIDKLYETLYAAANNNAKGVLLEEKLQFENEAGNLAALYGDEALAEALRMKCAELCCVMHTASETLPSSLTANLAVMTVNPDAETTTRVIGALRLSDSEVTDTFAGPAARALEATMDLLHSAKSYNYGDVFLRAQQLWQGALDQSVNADYAAADRDARKLIVLWRTSLDSLLAAERPLLELLYPDNRAQTEESLMNIYKDAGFAK